MGAGVERQTPAERWAVGRHADWLALAVLVAMAVVMEWDRLTGPAWVGMDTATAFFPWYSFLGEQLRLFQVPVWNPHTFSGTPFAADPESGWMYLPAMVLFSALPLDAAVRASLLFHVLLAALSTYALARELGANQIGGVLAATIYAHSGFFEGHNVCCYAYADVAAWLPLSLLGAEMALSARTWPKRMLAWGVAGLAFSQILAAWVGQGAYYAVLVLGSYVVVRGLTLRPWRPRIFAANALGIAGFSLALAAAGLLPRIEYNLVSNLPGGYADADVSLRATTWLNWGIIDNWDRLLLQPGFEYIGWPALLLALLAVPLLLSRYASQPNSRRTNSSAPRYSPGLGYRPPMLAYFVALGVVVLVLARAQPTPLHALFSLLPGFEHIHARSPERAMIVFYLAPAILAGASVTFLTRAKGRLQPAGMALGLAVVALVCVDLRGAWLAQSAESLAGGGDYQFARVDLASYLAPTQGAEFLMRQSEAEPTSRFRYFGYAGHVFGGPMPYTLRWTDPSIGALEVNNRALLTGLEDIEGYNPVHVARYGDFVDALNGQPQNYHHADVFETGFDSPLLDLLGVRYVVLPSTPASDELLPRYSRLLVPVYRDDSVQILENPSAMPRAWLVHAAVEVAPGGAASALVDAAVDLRKTAVVETPPPRLAQPVDAGDEAAEITTDAPADISFSVRAAAPALLIASEVAYPAWRAYLDGQPTQMYVADGALRGVAVPAGEHSVEMRYESVPLQIGLLITSAAAVLLGSLAILAVRARDESGEVRCKSGAVPQL
jgi:hypothetical protein